MTFSRRFPAPYAVMRRSMIVIAACAVVMALIENSGFWYWVVPESPSSIATRPFSGPFRQLLRLVLLLTILGTFALGRFEEAKAGLRVLAPLVPFFLFGLLAMFWTIAKVDSAKLLTNWALVCCGMAAASGQLSPERLKYLLTSLFTFGVGSSFFAYIFLPDIATGYHYGDPVMRGLFVHKNTLGSFSAVGAAVLVALGRHKTVLGIGVLVLLWAGALASGSAAALAIGSCGTIFVLALRGVLPHPQFYLPFVVLTVSIITFGALTMIFALEWVSGLLGRNATLSGRTLLWQGFLDAFGDRIALGQGPGLFSSISQRGLEIAGSLNFASGVGHPHNLYIALLGEVGIVGLLFFVGGHLWIMLVSPFRNRTEWSVMAAGLSFMILLRAMAEDHEGYRLSVAFILIVLARGQLASGAGKLLPKGRGPRLRSLPQSKVRSA